MNCSSCQDALAEAARYCARCGVPVPPHDPGEGLEAELALATCLAWRIPGLSSLLTDFPELGAHPHIGVLTRQIAELLVQAEASPIDPLEKADGDSGFWVFQAREGHPPAAEEAMRVAIEVRELCRRASSEAWTRTGEPIEVSLGLDTGKLVLWQAGDGLPRSAQGAPLWSAQMLARAAPADQILLDPTTALVLEGTFPLTPADPVQISAQGPRMRCFRLEHGRARAPARRRPLLTSRFNRPLVGREAVVAQVREALEPAVTEKRLRRCVVVGEPGVGKGRVVREVLTQLRGGHRGLLVGEAEIPNREEASVPFGILGRIVSSLAGLDRASSHDEARQRLTGSIRNLHHRAGTAVNPLDEMWILHLAGVSEVPAVVGGDVELASEVGHRAVVELLRTASRTVPVLLLFEDIHLALPRELATLSRLADDLVASAVMILCTSAEDLLGRAEWTPLKGRDAKLQLGPLPREAARVMVDQVLGRRDALGRSETDALIQHTGASPAMIEETLSAMVETGVLSSEPSTGAWRLEGGALPTGLPTTLEGVVEARIDQLRPAHAQVLRKAAVCGNVFWLELLEELGEPQAGSSLERLESTGLVVRSYSDLLEGFVAYQFASAIVRQVAARDLDPEVRKQLHQRIGRWLALVSGERFNDWLGAIASHFSMASDTAQAVAYYVQAGNWARARGDVMEAAYQFERARQQADTTEVAMEVALELGDAYFVCGKSQEALDELAQALTWFDGKGDAHRVLRALVLVARIGNEVGNREQAATATRRGLELADALGGTRERGQLLVEKSRMELSMGLEDEALASALRSKAAFAEVGDHVGVVRATMEAARPLLHTGQLNAAYAAFREAGKTAREMHHLLLVQRAEHGMGWVALCREDAPEARRAFEGCTDVFGRVGARRLQICAQLGLAITRVAEGRYEEAANLAAQGLQHAAERRMVTLAALGHAVVGHVYGTLELRQHRLKAKQLTEHALKAARLKREVHFAEGMAGLERAGPRVYRILAHLYRAEYLLAKSGQEAEGRRALEGALVLAAGFEACGLTDRLQDLRGRHGLP
jgi:tetratricopeptide (TPR) repeat protein